MPTITFNFATFKDRLILLISMNNHAYILRDAKVICKMALTMIVHNAVGVRLTKINNSQL